MSYVTSNTKWPAAHIDDKVCRLIAWFYELADNSDDSAAERLAREVFTADGILSSPEGTFKGPEEIITSRRDSWAAAKAKQHIITKAYMNDEAGLDLVLAGNARIDFKDGKTVEVKFMAHTVVDGASMSAGDPRISYKEVYPIMLSGSK